ncbi:hypothetical protein QE152_g38291, partial [Popillia japonica]
MARRINKELTKLWVEVQSQQP